VYENGVVKGNSGREGKDMREIRYVKDNIREDGGRV
jgi:hypothetical protein